MSTVAIRPSASLIVVAPHEDKNHSIMTQYRVLMVKRNDKSSFVHAHVFPGGLVDPHDDAANWPLYTSWHDSSTILRDKLCAIRETFEETGLLLTHPTPNAIPMQDIVAWRHKIHSDASQFKVMCDQYSLLPAVDQLVPFTTWVTPTVFKKRYHTRFFLTVLSPQALSAHNRQDGSTVIVADDCENVQLDWVHPEQVIKDWHDKKVVLAVPQWYTLSIMASISDPHQLIHNAGVGVLRTSDHQVISILPQIITIGKDDDMRSKDYKQCFVYPGDEFYKDVFEECVPPHPGDRHRLYFRDKLQDLHMIRNVDISHVFYKSRL